jgi:MtN3 and saliva related transmembrane protein
MFLRDTCHVAQEWTATTVKDGGGTLNLPVPLFSSVLHGVSEAELVGYVAAACTTFSFIPQIVKISKQGGEDLSYAMLGTYLVGQFLWLFYGMILHSGPVVIANVVSILLVAGALVLKAIIVKPMPID